MSPVQHPVSGPALAFSLADELRTVHDELAKTERRIGRTLVKDGPLRVTLVGLNPGGELRPHRAEGPITVHVLEGELEFEAGEKRWPLTAGSLLALDAGITHSVRSERGGVFLLTVVHGERDGSRGARAEG
jgi:quercetin dioxygenase-like cupin family protein